MRGAKNFKNVFILAQKYRIEPCKSNFTRFFSSKNELARRFLIEFWQEKVPFIEFSWLIFLPILKELSEWSTILTVKQLKLQLFSQTWTIVNDPSWIIRVKPQKSLLNKLLNCLKCFRLLFLHLESGLTEWGLKEKSYRCTWGYSFYGCFKIALCWWLLSLSGLGKW